MKTIIKALLITLVVAVFFQCKKEPTIVSIPDNNFLNALIKLGIDKDGDGLISTDEAAILHKGGKIREIRAKETIGVSACIRKSFSDAHIKFLNEEDVLSKERISYL